MNPLYFSRLSRSISKNKLLYLMLLPGLIFFVIFKYVPMLGIVITFQDYMPGLGFRESPWVGTKHFERLFSSPEFLMLLRNTLMLFVWTLVFVFPIPIILSLLLNEVRFGVLKRAVQTVIYIPHFLSWVIVVSLTFILLTPEGGIITELIAKLTGEQVNFLMSEFWFRPLYVIQANWHDSGWGTIIYLAALAGIDPGLYEAARMDGANRLKLMWHITLPAIRSTIVILLILKTSDILELSFDHVYLMLNSMNRGVAEVFDTYVYTTGILQGQFSYSTTVGIFKSLVGLIMVIIANSVSKKFGEEGIF